MTVDFVSNDLFQELESRSEGQLDEIPFGIIAMTAEGNVVAYNKAESQFSGMTPSRVIGRHFFSSVAPCTNNYLVAQRFELEEAIDDLLDYVFTLRMAPTPVQLRLLKQPGGSRMYLAVKLAPRS